MICNLIQTASNDYFTRKTIKGLKHKSIKNRRHKVPKRTTPEWLKWKHSCQDYLRDHGVVRYCRRSRQLALKVVRKWAVSSIRLIVEWGDKAHASLSSKRAKHQRVYSRRDHMGSRGTRKTTRNKAWIQEYLKAQENIALVSSLANPLPVPMFDSDSYPVLIDNCCTACITNCIRDFCEEPRLINSSISGIGGPIGITHQGTIKWSLLDDQGRAHTFRIPNAYYAPKAPHRLLSPQHWSQTAFSDKTLTGWATTYHDRVVLHWNKDKCRKTIPLDVRTNVAKLYTSPGTTHFRVYAALMETQIADSIPLCFNVNVVSADDNHLSQDDPKLQTSENQEHQNDITITEGQEDTEQNITPAALMLKMHYKLGHLSFSKIQDLAKNGYLDSCMVNCRHPVCAACSYGKATKTPWRTRSSTQQAGPRLVVAPGLCVSVDQMESPIPGLMAHMKGTPTKRRYSAATIFVDHYSRLGYVHLQETLTAQDTLQAKESFERYCESFGVKVKQYHADNGRFAENAFINDARRQGQTITYCGVNAHFQNGIAEKRIRDLQDSARTMMLHATARWPKVMSPHLWPYALRMANDVQNAVPTRKDGKSAIQVFSCTDVKARLRHFRPLGCPVYVLQNDLQAGQQISKWHKRARVGLYLGHSPTHARSVALVLNINTGLVSPQFHVKFDEFFETVNKHSDDYPNRWKTLTHFEKETQSTVISDTAAENISKDLTSEYINMNIPEGTDTTKDTSDFTDQNSTNEPTEDAHVPTNYNHKQPVQWSQRHAPSQRLKESIEQGLLGFQATFNDYEGHEEYLIQRELSQPIAFAASKSDSDTMYMHQAMNQPDKRQFQRAMQEEINAHTENKHWEIISRNTVPEGVKVLPSVWAMKRKRRIATGEIYKWKARLNLHGGKQEHGVNYWETYAATLAWPTIRFLLTQSIIMGWKTRQIDFTLAYPQAEAECQLYMEIPKGFKVAGGNESHCLKILKNIYGQRQAGRVWSLHLKQGLQKCGFSQSNVNDCVFYNQTVIFMVYVDDAILLSPYSSEINKSLQQLRQHFKLTEEGEIADYLGLKVQKLPNGNISLSQPHLIASILKDINFSANTKMKSTPAVSTQLLQRDLDGDPFNEHWDYQSVIGKLNFLEKSSRPDIAFAVHQCARFTNNPKKTHAEAVKHIARYLIGTRDKGLILQPNIKQSFLVWADADFVGNWSQDTAMSDVATARSRSGYLITYSGCPISWASKMQTEIALSTTESEYISLSTALRETIPMMRLIEEVKLRFDCRNIRSIPTIHCTLFEDNLGALELANTPKMRPRTRHINVKYHHFREHVRKKLIGIQSVRTTEQLADIFTKPLPRDLFIKFRDRILLWEYKTIPNKLKEGV